MNVLVLNAGSSSLKYAVINTQDDQHLCSGTFDVDQDYAPPLQALVSAVSGFTIHAVGHRVVHGGNHYADAVLITEKVCAAIDECTPLAPLHNPKNLEGIRSAQKHFSTLPHVAVFDTAFHAHMPRRAKNYAIDQNLNLQRFGFHGTSHRYVAECSANYLGRPLESLRLITCHLGNGASVAAVEYGRSADTSMGMTPLEGLVMGTRAGDIDAGAVLALLRMGHSTDEVDNILNRKSGLFGLSGLSHDMRELEAAADDGHDGARLAIAVFCHRLKKYIGAYAAAMGGVDAIVMTGGIGENSALVRQRSLCRLEFLGLLLDDDKNRNAKLDAQQPVFSLHSERSSVQALAVKTDEALMIAQETAAIVKGHADVSSPKVIPIAVSARHAHLTPESFAALFGTDATLEAEFELSQPGQFASKQRVSVIGPRGRIDRIRILGPLRPKNQVEVSRSDEFRLGVDAPVRRSGKVEGSAPMTLEGPAGRLELSEGLICAWRHIHMTTDDAKTYGVADGDVVEVKISGGPRDLTFGDVLVRVKDSYRLEMHIDTDEANAAELSMKSTGELVYHQPEGNIAVTLESRERRRG